MSHRPRRSSAGFLALVVSLILPALAPPPASAAPPSDQEIDAAVARLAPDLVAVRHHLHQHPELSNREVETSKLVAERLRALGLEVRTGVAHTGVVGVLRGGAPGPVVAVRADMDALPVTEQTDLPWRSTVRTTFLGQEVGVAHACGHDIHTSVGLGVAAVLAGMRDRLPGTVLFVFQPAEEGPPPGERGGAPLMLEEGALDDPHPSAIFALHSFPDLEVGQIGWAEGPTMAAVDQFVITIHGKQAHGALPQLSIDPIVMAAQAVEAFQTIRSRNLPPTEPSVITVGIIRGGERFNIIPAEVHLEGTVRTFRPEIRAEVERRMREILDGVTRAAGGGSFEMDYEQNALATVNDKALAEKARPTLERVFGADHVVVVPPTTAGEDFAYFAQKIPGFYFRLGVLAPGTTSGGLHTPTFNGSDDAIAVGMRAMSHLVVDYMASGGLVQ
jgi:amidohydrolase